MEPTAAPVSASKSRTTRTSMEACRLAARAAALAAPPDTRPGSRWRGLAAFYSMGVPGQTGRERPHPAPGPGKARRAPESMDSASLRVRSVHGAPRGLGSIARLGLDVELA